jgi:hypothetical protein
MSVGIHIGVLDHNPRIKCDVEDASNAFDQPLNVLLASLESSSEAGFYDVCGPGGRHCFGRSELDHGPASAFAALAELASAKTPKVAAHLSPFARLDRPILLMPYNSAFPLAGRHCYVLSAHDVQKSLVSLAPAIEIEPDSKDISDQHAEDINDCLNEEFEELQTAWLLLFEASRLSIANERALLFC